MTIANCKIHKEDPLSDIQYPYYRSYLVRIWQETARTPWRGSLTSVTDGTTLMFASVEAMLIFLLSQAQSAERSPPPNADSSPASTASTTTTADT